MPKVCQSVPEEDGNIVSSSSFKVHPCYKYDFTLNNYTPDEVCQVKLTLAKICKKAVFGFEIGDGTEGVPLGTPHLQGCISLIKKERMTGLHKLPGLARMSFRKTRNEEALIRYVQKDGKDIWRHGFPEVYRENIENFFPWETEILRLVEDISQDRYIHWFWEPTGCAGKTTFQKYLYTHFPDVVVLGGKGSDMKNGVVQYQEKNKKLPKIILINIPKSVEHISYTGIEEVKDMFFFSGKYEGGMVCGPKPLVLCFANEEPKTEKMSLDRWLITRI